LLLLLIISVCIFGHQWLIVVFIIFGHQWLIVVFVIGVSIHHHLTMEEVTLLDSPAPTEPSPRCPPINDVKLHYFLEDEAKTAPLKVTTTEIAPLIEGKMLTTTLMDYLLQRFINPAFITPEMIVPSSEFIPRMKIQLNKLSKTNRASQKTMSAMQTKFHRYSLGPHHFLALCCEAKHFFVFSIKFNACSENVNDNQIITTTKRSGVDFKVCISYENATTK
jgi:hypothetical protein